MKQYDLYTYNNRKVVIIQINEKKQRVEISKDLKNLFNPFWVDINEIVKVHNTHMIKYNRLHKGMYVQDNEGNVGIIVNCKDIHNINVAYNNGGTGLYCLVKECIEVININNKI